MLDRWGREFALARDCHYLGHQSENILAKYIQHEGPPPRTTGYKPLEVDSVAMAVEWTVHGIGLENVETACCLRAYFCGSGRVRHERLETARAMIARAKGHAVRLSRRGYLSIVDDGIGLVRRRMLAA